MVTMQKAAVNVMLIPPLHGGRSIHDMKALENHGVSLSWILQNDNDLSVFLEEDMNKRF